MIKKIRVQHFKGIRDEVEVDVRPITLLFGPNSAGKSSIIQALLFAHEALRGNLNPDLTDLGGRSVDLGGFVNLLPDHDKTRAIELAFELDLATLDFQAEVTNYSEIFHAERGTLRVSVEWSDLLEAPQATCYELHLDGRRAGAIKASKDGREVFLELDEVPPGFTDDRAFAETEELDRFQQLWSQHSRERIPIAGQATAIPSWNQPLRIQGPWEKRESDFVETHGDVLITTATPEAEFSRALGNIFVGVGEAVLRWLDQLRYLGPLREIPPRNYEALRSADRGRWAEGLSAWDLLSRDEELVRETSRWLSSRSLFNTGYSLELSRYWELHEDDPLVGAIRGGRAFDDIADPRAELERLPSRHRLHLVDEENRLKVLPPDVGTGLSQLIPFVVAALAPGASVVASEQPELHIHPAMQVTLGDLLIQRARREDAPVFLIETHSEHLILRLLRRIRESTANELPPGAPELTPAKIAVYWVEQQEEGVKLTELGIDKTGEFTKDWPRGFFEERAGELFT